MQQTVLFVAGGSGTRMKSTIPKQFLEISGLPVLMHTIKRFLEFNATINIRIVLPEPMFDFWEKLCTKHNFEVKHTLYPGGKNRFQSVKNGLNDLCPKGLTGIHDGVRPLVSIETIRRCFKEAETSGAAIPVVDVIETLRETQGEKSVTVDRNKFKLVQTPQVFHNQLLIKAYQQNFSESFTDDASVVESLGHPVSLVEGNRENIKITNPLDIKLAETLYSCT
jgi:2-C-methyl-D-erythritol 4-phosphate cytidylyltransferase